MGSIANLHAGGGSIHAFASSAMDAAGTSTLVRGYPRYQMMMMMIMNSPSKRRTSSSSAFISFRKLDEESSGKNWFFHWCSRWTTTKVVIATQQSIIEDDADGAIVDESGGAGVASQDCSWDSGCQVDYDEGENMAEFSAESFSKLLRRVSLAGVRTYAELCHLGNLSYHIPKIKADDLLRGTGLRFVASHLERNKQQLTRMMLQSNNGQTHHPAVDLYDHQTEGYYYYRQGITGGLLAAGASDDSKWPPQENDAPCGWYICDDDQTGIRYFIIQGSESLASWQANLRFEPAQFEDREVLVHSGIYDAAMGIYEQLRPEIQAHLRSATNRRRPLLQFTGHSLGGSIATLLNLMLLIRAEAPISALLPVVTFGSPFIMCGGEELMQDLGLPRGHVQGVVLHRDIVPKAFSVTLADRLIDILKAVNANFRCHPCLNDKRLVYDPMGEFLILQPEESFSPSHHLLPPGPGLYLLSGDTLPDTIKAERMVKAAQAAFLNSPYPTEILKDPAAYGSFGTISRDHDMNSYLKSLHDLIKYEVTRIQETGRARRNRIRRLLQGLPLKKAAEDNKVDAWRSLRLMLPKMSRENCPKNSNISETDTESVKPFWTS
uniref:Fungal lipase-type domain-containing protein n=1 Tax=Kalanchoe fedtschenkoi TaxID=63787 RepID=A0A7N0TTB1_KALFE